MALKLKIRKGDKVVVRTGRDKGKVGEVLRVFPEDNRALVQGVNLVRRHQKGVWRVVRRYVKRDADAADITQQVFVRAFKGLATFRGAASVRSWLYRIAINAALTWIRDHKREVSTEIAEDPLTEMATAPGRIANDQDGKRLRAAIEQLPPKQKMVPSPVSAHV